MVQVAQIGGRGGRGNSDNAQKKEFFSGGLPLFQQIKSLSETLGKSCSVKGERESEFLSFYIFSRKS